MKLTFGGLKKIDAYGVPIIQKPSERRHNILKKSVFGVFYGRRE